MDVHVYYSASDPLHIPYRRLLEKWGEEGKLTLILTGGRQSEKSLPEGSGLHVAADRGHMLTQVYGHHQLVSFIY